MPRRSAHSSRADRLVALAADQHDLVADARPVVVAAVDHELVHRDDADDRAAAAADQHLAAGEPKAPRHAVGVADRHGGDDASALDARSAARRRRARRRGTVFTYDTRAFSDIAGRRSTPAVERRRRARCRRRRCRSARGRSARRGWASAPAELAACTSGGSIRAPRERGEHRVERGRAARRCSGLSGSSATARWVQTPSSCELGDASTIACASAHGVVRRGSRRGACRCRP